jgi:aminoglycoside phosphotransferase (APT) family kinase protein
MFEWEDGRLLRLLRNPDHAPSMQWETAAEKSATAGGVRVPAIYETLSVGGRPGMVVERIYGKDLLEELAARPWRIWSLGRVCGRLHARLNSVSAGNELPEVRQSLAVQIRVSSLVPERYAEFALKELETLPEGDRLCHGDFHPGNVMLSDGEPVVIDWPNATRGDYHSDFARGTLVLKLGDPPDTAPWLIRFSARFARTIIRSSYEGAYRKALTVDPALHRRWETVRAIHRLQDGIDSEREKLLRLAEERLSG